MKTRLNFISNSSSSSYIIVVKSGNPCPYCGRQDLSFIDYIKNTNQAYNYGDDTQYVGDKKYILESLYNTIERYNNEIRDLQLKNQDSSAYYWQPCRVTPKEEIKRYKELINNLNKTINKIQSLDDDSVHEIKISYHDSQTQQLFAEQKRLGIITVLETEGD